MDQLAAQEWINQDQFHPRFNIAPRSNSVVLRQADPEPEVQGNDNSSSGSESDRFVLQTMKWGLVPNWSKFEDTKMNTTNARAENLVDGGGMWNSIKGKKRCAVVADGYYEWQTKGKEKLPFFTHYKGGRRLMLFAGLWDCVTLEVDPLWTFTIVTTAANKEFEWLHDRQPVILSNGEMLHLWLNTSSKKWDDSFNKLLDPYADKLSPLECYRVPKEVGKVGSESATFIEPIEKRKDGIQAMFAKQKANADIGESSPKKPGLKPESSTKQKSPSHKAPDRVQIATNKESKTPKTSILKRNIDKEPGEPRQKGVPTSKREVIEIEDSSDEAETPAKKVNQLAIPITVY
ncbi:DUF159-domain-containing protein [Cylindrobasidium torrendii FP15055 ss-10]|uniref:DUF159-domain-containing protein n=1 Tax=Cylindrobasidium torrendii FP15055 ss-10 TaxID=1314674 RepID=A0A0D7BS44_9AGAR|nr:DUF159-domain-containing protein [Cylindrobasidium torrendii FP15055 ss-10]